MKRLNSEHIKLLHSILLEETGGLNGARDENMFGSAVNSPLSILRFRPLMAFMCIPLWSAKRQDVVFH